jgi:hypothetical protein
VCGRGEFSLLVKYYFTIYYLTHKLQRNLILTTFFWTVPGFCWFLGFALNQTYVHGGDVSWKVIFAKKFDGKEIKMIHTNSSTFMLILIFQPNALSNEILRHHSRLKRALI